MIKSLLKRIKDVKLENLVYYILAILAGLFFILWYQQSSDYVVSSLLLPHAKATEIYYNISLNYISGIGYSSNSAAFVIGKECMGINFIVLMFIMQVCAFTKYFNRNRKPIWFIVSLFSAVITGIIISCLRIIGSVPFVSNEKFGLLHTGSGIALYFLALVGSYYLCKKFIGGFNYEETNKPI